jgi:hypothetical protein
MASKKLHPKFIPEKTCLWCDCTFLPSDKSTDEYCEDCTRYGYKLPNSGKKPDEPREYLYRKPEVQPVITPVAVLGTRQDASKPYKSKMCKKCGSSFVPSSPAVKNCNDCRSK